ncbi:MAG: tail fiber domain-containing protein, partial [Cyclobacteriaceae bacterium]
GAATLNSAGITNNATVGGTLGVTGATTTNGIGNTGNITNSGDVNTATLQTSGAATLNSAGITNNATVGGTLGVTGATTTNGIDNTGAISTTTDLTVSGHDGSANGLILGATLVTATATELNLLDGLTAIEDNAAADQTATEVTSTATGNIIATNVDAAIAELEAEKQPIDTDLTAIAGLANTNGNFIVGSAGGWVAESGATARTSLGLTIGTDVQAYDAGLNSIAGLTTSADQMVYTTGSDVYATTSVTAFARTILDDANQATAQTTLGLGTGDSPEFTGLTISSLGGSDGQEFTDINGTAENLIINSSGVFSSSDRRLKENIVLLQNTIEKLNVLGGYNYNYKADATKKQQIGVIAQELEKVFPELVSIDERGFKIVNYQGLIPVLMQALKEQQMEIDLLNSKLKNQESKLSELSNENKEMKNDIEYIKKMIGGGKPSDN